MLVIAIEFERIQSQHIHLMLAGAHVLYGLFICDLCIWRGGQLALGLKDETFKPWTRKEMKQ